MSCDDSIPVCHTCSKILEEKYAGHPLNCHAGCINYNDDYTAILDHGQCKLCTKTFTCNDLYNGKECELCYKCMKQLFD